MKYLIIFILSISLGLTNFISKKQYDIESLILAPCCYGGVVSEHNSPLSKLISNFIEEIYSKDYSDKESRIKFDKIIEFSKKNGFLNSNFSKNSYHLIKQNMQDEEILNLFINLYGEKIRAVPQNNFFGKITWIFPLLIMIVGILTVTYVIKNLSFNNSENLSDLEIKKIEKQITKNEVKV